MSLKKKKKSKNKTEPSCCGYCGLPARLAGPAQQRTRLGRHKAGAVESARWAWRRRWRGRGAGQGGVTRALRLASPGSLFHWRSLCVRVLRTLETALVLPEDLPSACLDLVGAGKCPPELTYQREPGEGGVAAANGRLLKKAESPGRTDDLDRPLLPPRGRRG